MPGSYAAQAGNLNVPLDSREYAARRLNGHTVWVESPLHRNELDIYWLPPSFAANVYPKGFNIYRGHTPVFTPTALTWQKLNDVPITVPMFRDSTADVKRREQLYYVVTAVMLDDREMPLDDAVTLLQNENMGRRKTIISPPRVYREYRRRKWLILENDAERVDVLIRILSGERCPKCFSGEYEGQARPDCDVCFGTGYRGGYVPLRDVMCRILSIEEVLRLQPAGLQMRTGPKAWLVDFPIMRNGDIIVRHSTGQRYEVDLVDFVVHQGILTEQNFNLNELPETHPIYDYTLPEGIAPG
jgi:hypothetical protein